MCQSRTIKIINSQPREPPPPSPTNGSVTNNQRAQGYRIFCRQVLKASIIHAGFHKLVKTLGPDLALAKSSTCSTAAKR